MFPLQPHVQSWTYLQWEQSVTQMLLNPITSTCQEQLLHTHVTMVLSCLVMSQELVKMMELGLEVNQLPAKVCWSALHLVMYSHHLVMCAVIISSVSFAYVHVCFPSSVYFSACYCSLYRVVHKCFKSMQHIVVLCKIVLTEILPAYIFNLAGRLIGKYFC